MPGVSTATFGWATPSGAIDTSSLDSSSVYESTGAMLSRANSSGNTRLATVRFSST